MSANCHMKFFDSDIRRACSSLVYARHYNAPREGPTGPIRIFLRILRGLYYPSFAMAASIAAQV